MSHKTAWYFWGLVVGGLIVLGSLEPAWKPGSGLDLIAWIIASVSGVLGVAALTWHSFGAPGLCPAPQPKATGPHPRWSIALTMVLVAVLLPVAVVSIRDVCLSSLAMLGTLVVAFLFLKAKTGAMIVAGWSACLIACALEPSSALLPLGIILSTISTRKRLAWALVLAIVGGIVVGRAAGIAITAAHTFHGAATGLQRDVLLLSPLIMLGIAGVLAEDRSSKIEMQNVKTSKRRNVETPQQFERFDSWTFRLLDISIFLRGWLILGAIGLLLCLFGVPLDVRLCVLPFLFWAPGGLADFSRLFRREGAARAVSWTIGLVCTGLFTAMLWPGIRRLPDGLLIAVQFFG